MCFQPDPQPFLLLPRLSSPISLARSMQNQPPLIKMHRKSMRHKNLLSPHDGTYTNQWNRTKYQSQRNYLWRKLKKKGPKKHENSTHMHSKQRTGTRWPIRCSNAPISWTRKRALKSQVARSGSESCSPNPSRNCPNSHLHWRSGLPL